MSLPEPEPGLVISHAYLWRYEHEAGQEEGRKNRPCVIVLAVENNEQGIQVTVAPITHRPPEGMTIGVELPLRVKQHLGLDAARSWVIVSEVTSENAVRSQIWIAVSVYVLVAIIKKRLGIKASLYTILQILSVTPFEKTPVNQAFFDAGHNSGVNDADNQLMLFD